MASAGEGRCDGFCRCHSVRRTAARRWPLPPAGDAAERSLSDAWREMDIDAPLVVGETAALWHKLTEFAATGESPLDLKANVVPSGTVPVIEAARHIDPDASIQAHAGNGIVIIKMSQSPTGGLSRALVGHLQPIAARHHGQVIVLANPSGAEMTHQSVWGATDSPRISSIVRML